ncbi:MAG: ABC transporter ATP-binding protein [Proteobacteria bacterium]|nr:MAG: ABC transporter ATP-binding protein [Pseudomonadota bacterium]
MTKTFQTWHERPSSLKTLLAQAIMFKFKMGTKESKTVLRDVNLTISKGEFVGLMGRNGVGKSTLLKLIAGIYPTTSGEIITRGRIAPLLELGAGFAPELTGYENIYLNASILGYGKAEIERKIQSIVEFSELKEAIERPVQNYSSGMLVRLGFAIAVHLDAEILLFDEILAVGDVGFQSKCLAKIHELHAKGGTIVLVTHTPSQVEDFCDRCVLFDQSGVAFDGDPKEGARLYRGLFNTGAKTS